MGRYIIANTPCGIYRGDLPIGYAYYQTLFDIHSRFLRSFMGFEVICHKYSLNVLGKRAEDLGLCGTVQDLDSYAKKWMEHCALRDRMNFSFHGNILDTDLESLEHVKAVFLELYAGGYVLRNGNVFYLDTPKIGKNFDLNGIAQEINFFSGRSRKEFFRIINDLKTPVRITKDRRYSVGNPLGGEGIAPIFGISNMWDAFFDQELDLMASSEKELARYLVLRFLSRVPISQKNPMKNILVYNCIDPEGGLENWDMFQLTSEANGSDSLRYSFAKTLSFFNQKAILKKDLLEGGKRLINLLNNLKIFFLKEGLRVGIFPTAVEDEYVKNMNAFKYSLVLGGVEAGIKRLSRDIDVSRNDGSLQLKKEELFQRYLELLRKLAPFCPSVSEKILDELR